VDTFKDRAEMDELHQAGRCPWKLWQPDDRTVGQTVAA
jgi:hypothetical protein